MSKSSPPQAAVSITSVVVMGLASLAAAMGIGRFAFTPLMPLMQAQDGLALADGAWLAAANYIGYLAGALASFALVPSASRAIRWGLLVVVIATAAMALPQGLAAATVLRFAAGVASAFVLVGVSGHALAALAAAGRGDLAGWVFAGVGSGIVFAGLLSLGVAMLGASTATAWALLAAAAAVVCAAGWPVWRESPTASATAPALASSSRVRLGSREWALVVAYGSFGLGYIIPATFLPAMARTLVPDPLVFGWTWPVFGLAAAASTVIVTRHFGRLPPRSVFIASVLLMSIGVALPALSSSMLAIVAGALAVGGTFMVATMAGMQEARRLLAGGDPQRLIAAMTAAFALGQTLGPLLVGLFSSFEAGSARPILAPSLVAAAVLLASAVLLRISDRRQAGTRPITKESTP